MPVTKSLRTPGSPSGPMAMRLTLWAKVSTTRSASPSLVSAMPLAKVMGSAYQRKASPVARS